MVNGQNAYAAAGVDTEAGDNAVELMRSAIASTMTADVVDAVGGFAGMIDASALRNYRRPLLATSTDGVGTKIAIAQAMGVHHTIGQDLVGMVVDDIAVVGARPLLMTDYIACGRVIPERIADIVRGVALACEYVKVPLLGGETAEHPGVMEPDDYDIAGAATGVVEADAVLGAQRVQEGDVIVAMAASGLHSNGYSLVRRIVADAGWKLDKEVPEFGRTLGEELLEPTRLYSPLCLDLAARGDVHAFSHVTGGGLAANLARVIPVSLQAHIDRGEVEVPAVYRVLCELGSVDWRDAEDTWNLGIGMVAVLPAHDVETVTTVCREYDCEAWPVGSITSASAEGAVDGSTGTGARLISGTKGVAGGSVLLHGEYR
ncbi:phosphoribosylformylglycinamidine cyclo-ligase [Actinobaculum sp. 352]|nr:phosphoribosylformylglycinamidine cyclo-ligase [Actinobaculum sp. 352]